MAAHVLTVHLAQPGHRLHGAHETALELLVEPMDLPGALHHLLLQVLVQVSELLVLPLRELLEAPVLLDQKELVDALPHAVSQVVIVPGLVEITPDGALVDCVGRRLHVRIARKNDAHRVRRDAADVLEHLDAAHARHTLVGDDDGELRLLRHLDGLLRRSRRLDLHVGLSHHAANRLQDVGFVVYEEDFR